MTTPKHFLTYDKAAKALGVGRRQLERYIAANRLAVTKPHPHIGLIAKSEIARFRKENRVPKSMRSPRRKYLPVKGMPC